MGEEAFEQWLMDHHIKEFHRTLAGASSNMESEVVRKMFSRSPQHKLMYEYLVGDGHSKAFLDVWDVYGICKHCEKVKSILNKRGGPETIL